MDRWEAQFEFWGSFGVPAYEQYSVPDADELTYPYITYQAASGLWDSTASLTASIWTRSTSWAQADALADMIADELAHGGKGIRYDDGIIWLTAAEPFAQSMGDPDDDRIRRKVLQVRCNFL